MKRNLNLSSMKYGFNPKANVSKRWNGGRGKTRRRAHEKNKPQGSKGTREESVSKIGFREDREEQTEICQCGKRTSKDNLDSFGQCFDCEDIDRHSDIDEI